MHPDVQEVIFITAIICGLIYACKTIPKGLQDVVDAAKSPGPAQPQEPPARRLEPDAEDKIDLETLRVLSEGHSFELRNAAIKIVSSRAVNTENRKLLLRHLASKSEHRRDSAINALWLLFYGSDAEDRQQRSSMQGRFHDKEAFEAMVTALVNVLSYHKKIHLDHSSVTRGHPPSPVRPFQRPPHEASLMVLLVTALRGSSRTGLSNNDNLNYALDAGVVTRWLSRYPFPCTLPQFSKYNYKKSDVCSLLGSKTYANDDTAMHEIVRIVSSSSRGANQLRAVGLKASRITENIAREVSVRRRRSPGSWSTLNSREPSSAESEADRDVRMIGGEDTAGEPAVDWTAVENWPPSLGERDWIDEPHPRLFERSHEEVSLRRRNREAIVVAERGQPLGRENILRRQDSDLAPEPALTYVERTLMNSMPRMHRGEVLRVRPGGRVAGLSEEGDLPSSPETMPDLEFFAPDFDTLLPSPLFSNSQRVQRGDQNETVDWIDERTRDEATEE